MQTQRILEPIQRLNRAPIRMVSARPLDHQTSSILHDLRNPLTAISGCAELLLDGDLTPGQTRRVALNVQRSAGQMRDLLAEFAQIAKGRAESRADCNLRAIVTAACEASGMADRDGIELLLNVPARIYVFVARNRMERVFMNLMRNAIEAMHGRGAIGITATLTADQVLVAVEDSGPGIPAGIRSRLFEPLVTSGKKDGLGLGLALSREAVRDQGGDLWVEAAAGARFVLSLPLSRRAA